MATTLTHTHMPHWIETAAQRAGARKAAKPSAVAKFFSDLWEDVNQKPLQAAEFAKHDMFREHINAMSISYFGLIVVLIAGSVFLLPALIPLLAGR